MEGIKGETIRDIISKSSIIKIDLKWLIFKYKENEFDLDKYFHDIADDEDKTKLEIIITVNYLIPLVINFVNKSKKKYEIIKCELKDWVYEVANKYFTNIIFIVKIIIYFMKINKWINIRNYMKIFQKIKFKIALQMELKIIIIFLFQLKILKKQI